MQCEIYRINFVVLMFAKQLQINFTAITQVRLDCVHCILSYSRQNAEGCNIFRLKEK
jgi:hypothetical protein